MRRHLTPTPPRGLIVEQFESEDVVAFSWSPDPLDVTGLTKAERAVLEGVLRGETNQEIASARSTSLRTVANQVASILAKTGASSRFDLLRMGKRGP